MGLAASQARLLSLTARIHDVEYQAQMIQSAKLQLALQEDEVYRKYNEALDATTLTFRTTGGDTVKATFNNLCGEGSIKNGMSGSKNYIFRDGSGNVIVPSDIYDGYSKFGGKGDAYAFAMFMMTGQSEGFSDDYSTAMTDYLSNNNIDGSIQTIIENKISKILDKISKDPQNIYTTDLINSCTFDNDNRYPTAEAHQNAIINSFEDLTVEDVKEYVLKADWASIEDIFGVGKEHKIPEDIQKDFNDLKTTFEQYQHKMFMRGAKTMYESMGGIGDFDQEKFNYYLRWGKQMELDEVKVEENGDLTGATSASDYRGQDLENDPELLNEMLLSGKITIDMVYVDNNTGNLNDAPTSTSSDSVLTETTGYDKAAIKKAEAEYEHAMKEIDKKDKRFDMDLNRLETERSALTTEYDSVKKVIQDNIERTFGIFS